MFDGGANPVFLKTLNIRGSEDSGQVRVLGEGLKALSDDVSLGRWGNETAVALCHRGGSGEARGKDAAKRR